MVESEHRPEYKLVSWENVEEKFPLESSNSIKFLDHVPEPNEEIALSHLEIDIKSLKLIKEFLSLTGAFPVIKKPLQSTRIESLFDVNSPYKVFFDKLNEDELLLLTLAAHKLSIENLQELCTAVIASKFSEMDATEVMNDLTETELTTNEEDLMRWIDFKWLTP